jgi:hypothetical protein
MWSTVGGTNRAVSGLLSGEPIQFWDLQNTPRGLLTPPNAVEQDGVHLAEQPLAQGQIRQAAKPVFQRLNVVLHLPHIVVGLLSERGGVEQLGQRRLGPFHPGTGQGFLGEVGRKKQMRVRQEPARTGEPPDC